MSRNEVILTVAAAALVGFSLAVSILVPRWRPEFPGRRVGVFAFVAIVLVAVMLGSVEVFGGEDHAAEAGAESTTGGETTGGQTTGAGTTTEKTTTAAGGDAARGEAVFESSSCGGCHTLAAANSSGTVGPNLDELKPSFDAVVAQVTNGGGAMPAFGDTLSEDDIKAVAAYVVASTQR